eukprot:6212955-Pleurochrysis_carterae.AAC.1
MYGWTMSYNWGHPVATLPVTNGTIRHTRTMTEILRITIQLAINYLGEVNDPDGLFGLYDQAPRMYRRVTRLYPSEY